MLTDKEPPFCDVCLTGIRVGGKLFSIPDSIFSKGGTIVDQCTVVTRLPAAAYAAVVGVHRGHGGAQFQEGVGVLHPGHLLRLHGNSEATPRRFHWCSRAVPAWTWAPATSEIMFPVTQAHV
jgi:hypothetical protein